jgi:hypothetical protein
VVARCYPDDSAGSISIFNPMTELEETREILDGEAPHFTIRGEDGKLGTIEWEHKPG